MRLQTGSAPTRRVLICVEYDHRGNNEAVEGTIDALADELHRR